MRPNARIACHSSGHFYNPKEPRPIRGRLFFLPRAEIHRPQTSLFYRPFQRSPPRILASLFTVNMRHAKLTIMRWVQPRQRRHRYLVELPDESSRDSMQRRLRDDVQPPSEANRTLPARPVSPMRRRMLILWYYPPGAATVRGAHLTSRSLLVGLFFSLLDTTIVSTSLLASSSDLNDFRDGSWVVLAYLLSFMGNFQPRLEDHPSRLLPLNIYQDSQPSLPS